MNSVQHAAAVMDSVTDLLQPKRRIDRAPYADVTVDDLVFISGFDGPQECRVWYDVDYEGFIPVAVFRYVTLEVKGHTFKFYERDLRGDEMLRIEDVLHDEMECAE